ncbi:hypothetical protein SARC_06745 [Sphaeroforma arctica JP610]|uniref:Uncharacterized protein n=1 Tax=Sphaeroforma arctica JP610 TaxID=667725 RepID=A0A0L0FW70_9EUKA|nr:hypothetical protein SARC_06745 [Sphaeroforma arctica JP610]KNC80904.1 hypothetical protein SARC_06745 [Sphaeroforma arctica JP610]|eukprot:XP_014154806.1 hypothetical protein SARC_06745 [Sphaeroforma arctica JP610]
MSPFIESSEACIVRIGADNCLISLASAKVSGLNTAAAVTRSTSAWTVNFYDSTLHNDWHWHSTWVSKRDIESYGGSVPTKRAGKCHVKLYHIGVWKASRLNTSATATPSLSASAVYSTRLYGLSTDVHTNEGSLPSNNHRVGTAPVCARRALGWSTVVLYVPTKLLGLPTEVLKVSTVVLAVPL